LLWGDDFHPINYDSLVAHHEQTASPLTLTVTKDHNEMNLLHVDGKISQYDKSGSPSAEFNGYESGTSVVEKAVLLEHGKDGKWSWEETVYPLMSMKATAYLDDTKFWDMGTPERLARLEEFLDKTSL
jgi:NDP-sugar pyrophosphorylase family protein